MTQKVDQDEINLIELVLILKKYWILVISSGPIVGIITFVILMYIPNIYVSEILLSPRAMEEGNKLSGGLSAIGSLAGVKLGGSGDVKVPVALEIIKSRRFQVDFVHRRDLIVDLFALKSWDGQNNIYDDEIYDIANGKWVRDVKFPRTPEPQDWEIFETFSQLIIVKEDDKGFIKVLLESRSPVLSKKWLTWIIEDVNEYMRQREQKELKISMNFLTKSLEDVALQNIRQIFFQLIAEQTKKLMMTESHKDFVFEILDPAFQPVSAAKPKKLLILVAMMMLAFILTSISVIVREYMFVSNKKD
ncbi:MAG: hypothetical protein COA93_02435 [Alphaproteobacteria bacterium]|nr:MAG: hypothetical protein COA93_02435 [Alphaproteobacteria bacterium]